MNGSALVGCARGRGFSPQWSDMHAYAPLPFTKMLTDRHVLFLAYFEGGWTYLSSDILHVWIETDLGMLGATSKTDCYTVFQWALPLHV